MQSFDEFRPQLALADVLQPLKLLFVLYGADECLAVPVLEEVLDEPPDPILVLDSIRDPLLLLQRVLQVLLRADRVALHVYQLQGEVPQDPKKRREVLSNLIILDALTFPDLKLLSQVDY